MTKALLFLGCAIGETRVEQEEIARLLRDSVRERALGAQLDLEDEDLRLLNELPAVSAHPNA